MANLPYHLVQLFRWGLRPLFRQKLVLTLRAVCVTVNQKFIPNFCSTYAMKFRSPSTCFIKILTWPFIRSNRKATFKSQYNLKCTVDLALLHKVSPHYRIFTFRFARMNIFGQIQLKRPKNYLFASSSRSIFLNYFKINECILKRCVLVDRESYRNIFLVVINDFVILDGTFWCSTSVLRSSRVRKMPFNISCARYKRDIAQVYDLMALSIFA